MLKKENEVKWTTESRKSLEDIKTTLVEALVLIRPYFSKEFLVFSFASEHTIAGILLQEKPTNFGTTNCNF